jgi:hypothetical protein
MGRIIERCRDDGGRDGEAHELCVGNEILVEIEADAAIADA